MGMRSKHKRTQRLDLLRSSLDGQLNLRNFPHLSDKKKSRSASASNLLPTSITIPQVPQNQHRNQKHANTISNQTSQRTNTKKKPHQIRRLRILLRRLLKSPLRRPYPPITLVHERKDVRLVLHLKPRERRVVRVRFAVGEEFGFEAFGVRFGTGAEVHFLGCFGVCVLCMCMCARREECGWRGEGGSRTGRGGNGG